MRPLKTINFKIKGCPSLRITSMTSKRTDWQPLRVTLFYTLLHCFIVTSLEQSTPSFVILFIKSDEHPFILKFLLHYWNMSLIFIHLALIPICNCSIAFTKLIVRGRKKHSQTIRHVLKTYLEVKVTKEKGKPITQSVCCTVYKLTSWINTDLPSKTYLAVVFCNTFPVHYIYCKI